MPSADNYKNEIEYILPKIIKTLIQDLIWLMTKFQKDIFPEDSQLKWCIIVLI